MDKLEWWKPGNLVSVGMTIACSLHEEGNAGRITTRLWR